MAGSEGVDKLYGTPGDDDLRADEDDTIDNVYGDAGADLCLFGAGDGIEACEG